MSAFVASLIFPDRYLPASGEVTVLEALMAPKKTADEHQEKTESKVEKPKRDFSDFDGGFSNF
jgi:hypothetical protein